MKNRYIIFYKPYGVLCQFRDLSATPKITLSEYIDIPRVYSVGRLDFDSEGLLLLTDDGQLKHHLIDPQFEHPRTYWVQVERIPTAEALQKLCDGVTIQGYRTKPAIATLLNAEPDLPDRDPPIRFRANIPTAWIELTLTEGKNRQIRKMTAAAGFPTLRLVRLAIANLQLQGLGVGEWRELTEQELKELKMKVLPRRQR